MFARLLQLLPVITCAWTNQQWAVTINKAGLQRTLSQQMTKEFLLISRGSKVTEYRAKLLESMSSFNTTLHALMVGDSSNDILPAPDHRVASALQEVELEWIPMEKLLRENMDTVRSADGSYNMLVLEELSSRNVPLLDTSDAVVKALVDAAQVSGASTNGLVQDIAGRQRTLIQRLAKGILFLSQGVSMTFNMKAYSNTKVLFETSHDGIIQGVPFAGLPVLNKMCTLHQMREVSFYYEQLRPLLTGITNAETPSTSQKAADAVAEEVVELLDPLFLAMVEAVKLFGQDDGSCNPSASMTHSEWHAFFMTLAQQEILTKTTMQYFTQVGLKVDVKSSQVEITVRLSQASGNLRNLIEGNKVKGIPAPPSQEIVDELLSVDATWKTFESELEAAVHLESVSSVTMARVDLLGERILEVLGRVMHMGLAMVTNTTVPAYVIDQSFGQALLACEITQSAVLLNFDHDVTSNWDSLNASRAAYTSTMWKLLEGEPGKYHRVTDVCLVHQVKHANDLFRRFEQAALSVGHGHSVDMENLVLLSPLVLRALEESAESLSTGNSSCGNTSLLADEWIQLHQKAAAIATLSQEITAEYILVKQGESHNTQRLEVLVEDLDTSLRHIMFGSFDPPIAAPPSQEKFDHMLTHLAPEVADLKQAIFGIDVTTVLNAGDKMMLDAQTLQDQYLEGLMSADPNWPGKRVDVARRQVTLAQKIMTEAALYAYDLRSSDAELNAVVTKFEQAHLQLRDGGGGLSEIMLPERQDLLTQWEQVDSAWQQVRGYLRTDPISRLESAILQLVAELTKIIPLYAMMDVKDPDTFPWPTLVYSIIGALILSCCCVMVILPWALSRRRATKTPHNGATVRSAADEV